MPANDDDDIALTTSAVSDAGLAARAATAKGTAVCNMSQSSPERN